jgi:(2S)-methylsuccinyl-CoA dehydrogenase
MTNTLFPVSGSASHSLALAQSILEQVRTLFQTSGVAVAIDCAVDGKLDADRLDAHQLVSYEIALASADLLAAEITISAIASTELNSLLSLVFATDAIVSIVGRLDSIFIEAKLNPAALHALSSSTDFAVLRTMAIGNAVLCKLGQAIGAGEFEIGYVELDGA